MTMIITNQEEEKISEELIENLQWILSLKDSHKKNPGKHLDYHHKIKEDVQYVMLLQH